MGSQPEKRRLSLFIIILILPLLSAITISAADPIVNHPYSDVLTNPYLMSNSEMITHSNDGTKLVVTFQDQVVIIDTETRQFEGRFGAGGTVESISFSTDDSVLIVGLESPYLNTLAVELYETESWTRFGLNDNGTNVNDISILDGQPVFASPNQREGVNEYFFNDSTNHFAAYNDRHVGSINCIDHAPSGGHLISGGSDGQLLMWNRSTTAVDREWGNEFSVTDCGFSPNGEMVAWLAQSLLQVRSYPDGDYLTSMDIAGDILQMEWSTSGQELFLLIQSSSPELIVIDTVSFTIANRIKIGHRVSHFSMSPTDAEFAVTSLTSHVTLFRENNWAPFADEEGVDNDEDGTPDSFDSDDDGDGIGDDFEYTCGGGIDCALFPNPESTRKISVTFNENTVKVMDRYLLNASQSASLRDLAASGITADGLVDMGEAITMESMLCAGISEREMIEEWERALKVHDSARISTSVECNARTGLIDTTHTDSKTKIQIRWIIEMTLSNDVDRPFSFSFDPNVSIPVHTAAQSTPNSPFTLVITHESETVSYLSPIYPSSQQMDIFIDSPPSPEPTVSDIALDWLKSIFWAPIVAIFILILVAILVTRWRNVIDLDIEDYDKPQVSHRRQSKRRQPAASPDAQSSTGRPQPLHHPPDRPRRGQPDRSPPDQRTVKRVRRVPGTITQTGEAPDGEQWHYSEHGAYWDSEDPDNLDPYGEAKEYHDEELEIQKIAQEMAAEAEKVIQTDNNAEVNTDNSVNNDESETTEIPKGEDMMAALRKITGGNISTEVSESVIDFEQGLNQDGESDQQAKNKGRRRVKRRKK